MILVCPKCGAENRVPDRPDPAKKYRCSKCKEAFSDIPRWSPHLDRAHEVYFKSVHANAANEFESALWLAWAAGASSLEGGLEVLPEFHTLPDNLEKAKQVVNLLVQPMVSIWFHNWDAQEWHSDEERTGARKTAFENVQTFLGLESASAVNLHLGLDQQLTAFLDKRHSFPAYYVVMLHQRYRECVAGVTVVHWDGVSFPIDEHEQFQCQCNRDNYVALTSPTSMVVAGAAVLDAGAKMFQEFRRLYGIGQDKGAV